MAIPIIKPLIPKNPLVLFAVLLLLVFVIFGNAGTGSIVNGVLTHKEDFSFKGYDWQVESTKPFGTYEGRDAQAVISFSHADSMKGLTSISRGRSPEELPHASIKVKSKNLNFQPSRINKITIPFTATVSGTSASDSHGKFRIALGEERSDDLIIAQSGGDKSDSVADFKLERASDGVWQVTSSKGISTVELDESKSYELIIEASLATGCKENSQVSCEAQFNIRDIMVEYKPDLSPQETIIDGESEIQLQEDKIETTTKQVIVDGVTTTVVVKKPITQKIWESISDFFSNLVSKIKGIFQR